MNHLIVGTGDTTELLLGLTKPGFLLIDDGPIAAAFLSRFPRAKQFDPHLHTFNPLKGIDYDKASDFIALLQTVMPGGAATLTKEDAEVVLYEALLDNPKDLPSLIPLSDDPAARKAHRMIKRLLFSPILKNVLCNPTNFSFKGSVIATIDRSQIRDFDALVLASFLVGQFKGQVIIPDFGFYGHDLYLSLIRQNRLTCAVSFIEQLPKKLQQGVLSIETKHLAGRVTAEDAQRLLPYFPQYTKVSQLTDP